MASYSSRWDRSHSHIQRRCKEVANLFVSPTSTDTSIKRELLLRHAWGEDTEAFVCVARLRRQEKTFEEEWFRWPQDAALVVQHIEKFTMTHDMYFCPQLFSRRTRQKQYVSECPNAWADLDTCPPSSLLVEPSVLLETSPRRYQALWIFEEPLDPADAEDLSKRIAYQHADEGCDKSGWDLTQLLRIPFTYNHKYGGSGASPVVGLVYAKGGRLNVEELYSKYPEVQGSEYLSIPFPEHLPDLSPEEIIQEHRLDIHPRALTLFTTPPEDDWSRSLYEMQMLLYESGLSREEVYVVATGAACNKFERDGRGPRALWKEICRTWTQHKYKEEGVELVRDPEVPPLLSDEERARIEATPTLVEEYIEWAKAQGDAAWQYHQVGAFVILSSLLAGPIRLPTSYGTVIPNLWFMILADTTLTRKTTSMDMAMDLLLEIDQDCILATDGSIEGLMTSLSMRPGRPSIFLRDEFSGLLEAMGKKDYYAGMAETLTKLYDGKYQKRILRKEMIEVRDPILILFAGGIKTRILQLLEYEHVASGFLPRFCFVTAESDLSHIRPLGPPTQRSLEERQVILQKFQDLYNHYRTENVIEVNGKMNVVIKVWEARLTPEAWARYNLIEQQMLDVGLKASHKDLATPSMDRLSKSGLKAAVLLASTRMESEVVVTEEDIIRAFYYIEQWRDHTLEVLNNIGVSTQERQLEQIYNAIKRTPGCHRSLIMRNYHLKSREADAILETLEQRGLVSRTRSGKTERLYPIEV